MRQLIGIFLSVLMFNYNFVMAQTTTTNSNQATYDKGLAQATVLAQTGTTLQNVAPQQPKYESCSPGDSACVARNEALNKQYVADLSAYNQAILQEASLARNNSLKQLAAQSGNSGASGAKNTIDEVESKNKKGSAIYKIVSMATMATSGFFLVKAFAKAPIIDTPALIKAGIFMGFSMLAKSQSGKHNSVAQAACNSSNQLSATQKNCVYSPNDPNYAGYGSSSSVNDMFNSDGSCATVQATCDEFKASLPAGVNIKDALGGISAFASNLKKSGLTVNPDGSIKLPNGKTLTPDQFTNAQALQDAGLSPVAAGQLASDLKNNPFGNIGNETQIVKTKDPKNPLSGAYGTSTINASGSGSGSDANKGASVLSEGAAIAGANTVGAGDRNLASDGSEGLVKDFNGELIGASSEDIFKKINRRYNLKIDQNSFLDQ